MTIAFYPTEGIERVCFFEDMLVGDNIRYEAYRQLLTVHVIDFMDQRPFVAVKSPSDTMLCHGTLIGSLITPLEVERNKLVEGYPIVMRAADATHHKILPELDGQFLYIYPPKIHPIVGDLQILNELKIA